MEYFVKIAKEAHYVEGAKLFSVQISSMSGRSIVAYSTKKLNFWRATLANLVIVRVVNIVRIGKFLARYARFIMTSLAFVAHIVKE